MTVTIPAGLCDYIESLQYEADARRDLCAFMIDHGMMGTEHFKKYQDEYVKFTAAYGVAKNMITKLYAPKGNWRLDFNSGELTYEE